ncbi:MAG: lysylphosphatidylglycerol synthase domain-containing protein, partial [Myxococcota bacterium]
MADALTSPAPSAPSWGAKTLKLVLRLAITAGVIALIFREVDLDELWAVLQQSNLWLVASAISFTLALNLVKPVRWMILVRAAVPETGYRTALKSLLVAAAGRIVLPSKIGEFARIFMIPGLKVSSGIGLTLIDILVEAQVALLWAIPGLFVLGGTTAAVSGVVGVIVIAVLTRAPHRCAHPIARLLRNEKLDRKLLSARDMMRRLGTRGWLKAICVTLVISVFRFSQLFVLLW